MSSPLKKKMKLEEANDVNINKREGEAGPSNKRMKTEKIENSVDIHALKRKNFVKACEHVSYNAYFDMAMRLQLIYLPPCINGGICDHMDPEKSANIKVIPEYAEQSINIELKSYTWYEALEICQMCLTPEQYLTANILKEIVEVMLNAQDDSLADYSIDDLIDRCQQILSQSFSLHPPCAMLIIRNLYKNFLTSPMSNKEKTYSNRSEFQSNKGVVKYCMNRLEYELSVHSKDDAIVNKDEIIPEAMTQSVKGLHWQKEKLEIFETLERPERIKRLMAVLESLIELLQFDLAIWHSRYKIDLGNHVMRSHKPLMTFVLWSDNVLERGMVNNNCRQIFKLFAFMIHLDYPKKYIQILATWLNVIIQTFYICEINSNSDYPNIGKYSVKFAKEFYKIIAEMPQDTITKIIEQTYPTFMQHLIGICHIQTLLFTNEDDIIKIITNFVKDEQWDMFPQGQREIKIAKSSVIKPKRVTDLHKYLAKISKVTEDIDEDVKIVYPKVDPGTLISEFEVDRSYMIYMLYIAFDAFLDAYSIPTVQETLDQLNEQIIVNPEGIITNVIPENCAYSVSTHCIKKYCSIYKNLTSLISVLQSLDREKVPEIKIFENLGLIPS